MNSWGPSLDPPRSSSGTVQLSINYAHAYPPVIVGGLLDVEKLEIK